MMKTMKLKWLFLASLLNNTGSALLWPLITVYVHDYLHESMTVDGIVMFFYFDGDDGRQLLWGLVV